jgi:hypothetical protein
MGDSMLTSMDSEAFRNRRRYNVDMKLVNKLNKRIAGVVINYLHKNKGSSLETVFSNITNYQTNSFSMFEFKKWL